MNTIFFFFSLLTLLFCSFLYTNNLKNREFDKNSEVKPTQSSTEEERLSHRIHAHLLIEDHFSAVEEAKAALQKYPESEILHLAFLRALCEKGEEMAALAEWRKLGAKKERALLENLAWGVLKKGERSDQFTIRATALMGAAFTRDAKALPLLLKELRSSNALLRSLAVQLSTTFGDAPLKEEFKRLVKEEKVWYVRLEVLRAIGQLRMTEMRGVLKEKIAHRKTMAEEKAEALVALVNMYEAIDVEELQALIKSNRSGLRELACKIVIHLNLKERASDLLPLLKDPSSDVRKSVLGALGAVAAEIPFEVFESCLHDVSPPVAITAGWLAILHGKKEGEAVLSNWLHGRDAEWQRVAAAALAATGRLGCALAYREMKEHEDGYVRTNLAFGLIGQRQHVQEAMLEIDRLLREEKDTLWMWDTRHSGIFRSLSPSSVKHIAQIPHYPQMVDQLVRLELLSMLCVLEHPGAEKAVKSFLQNQSWGVTATAAATLIEEGDDEALEIVRALMNDREGSIRLQAALLLALMGGDPVALKVLEEAYKNVDREKKMHILEAIGHVGDASSLSFLTDILGEPFQALRVVAASALIQTLYH